MIRVVARTRLSASDVHEVLELVNRVTIADGLAPLSEHVLLHLRHGGDDSDLHLLASTDRDVIVGYAHLDATDLVNGPSAEVAVDPAHRRHGIGRQLVASLQEASSDGRLRLWAHGEQASARALALAMGFRQARTLLQLRRSLRLPLPEVAWPADVVLRTFRPGADDAEWLDLNARAFAAHREQGRWTQWDLDQRLAEPWFDPAGFLVAEENGRMIGFHWTKVHGGSRDHHGHDHDHEPIGEVYIVCVTPQEHGRGLGRALTVAGLQYLRGLGLSQAMLYVEATNTAAITLYESLGFTRWDTDVEFSLGS